MPEVRLAWHRVSSCGKAKDVRAWARGCIECQTAKIHRHNRAPLHRFEKATTRFAHVHVDLVGPLPASKGYTHLLTVIDRFTRWPEAIPLAQTDTAAIGRAFALHWVARFGVPSDITSDRGAQFTSAIWRAIAESLGSENPPYNGLPSTSERSGREVSQIVEGGIKSPVNDDGLDGRVAMGFAWIENHAEARHGRVGGRDGIRVTDHSPGNVRLARK